MPKPAPYKGILTRPIRIPAPLISREPDMLRALPEELVESFHAAVRKLKAVDRANLEHLKLSLLARALEVHRHYNIDPAAPGAAHDLVMALLVRHEKGFLKDPRLSRMYQEFGINPEEPGSEYALANELACKYVPGFKLKEPSPPTRRLTNDQVLTLIVAFDAIETHLRTESGRTTNLDREIARSLSDEDLLKKLLAPEQAAQIADMIGGSRRRRKPNWKPLLCDKTIRDYLADWRSAFKFGSASRTPFGPQLVEIYASFARLDWANATDPSGPDKI